MESGSYQPKPYLIYYDFLFYKFCKFMESFSKKDIPYIKAAILFSLIELLNIQILVNEVVISFLGIEFLKNGFYIAAQIAIYLLLIFLNERFFVNTKRHRKMAWYFENVEYQPLLNKSLATILLVIFCTSWLIGLILIVKFIEY